MSESKGLGDTIAKITKVIKIKPCKQCKKRQEKLNKMFPYENKNQHNKKPITKP
jgi:hypothetical protein